MPIDHIPAHRSLCRRTPLTTLIVAIACCCVAPQSAAARVVHIQHDVNNTPTGHLIISPGRFEHDVVPGVRTTVKVTLLNDNETPIDVSVEPTDLGQSTDPRGIAQRVEHGEFGAGDWITSEVGDIRMAPFEELQFLAVVDPPVDAAVGSNLAGLAIDSTDAVGAIGTHDANGIYLSEGLIQLFMTVPGDVRHKLTISSVEVRDKFVFGAHRFAVWDVTFHNGGTVNEHVAGKVDVRSIFGNSAHSEPINDLIVLRGATRTER
ncbi:MAG: hypothetical protein JWN41_229, partial [Thermoleophilia bacterium]|nr:hypothetical protein [Thermoleophilia bacterium]